MRIGIAGLGFGTHLLHTLLLRDDCTVVACADHRAERVAFGAAHGIATFNDAQAMIAGSELDAVVLASPPHVREPGLMAALDKGLAVFIEKPLAGNCARATRLVQACKGHRVMLGFSFRFHAPVQLLLAEIQNGLGEPRMLNAEYLFDWLPPASTWLWRAEGGGFFNENSCHLFDVVMAIMGELSTVYARGFDNGARPSATSAALTLGFPNGAVAALTLGGEGTGAFCDYPCLDLACANGQAKKQGRSHMWTGLRWARRGNTVQSLQAEPEALGRTRYSDGFDHFIAAVREGTPIVSTPADGLRAVALAEGVYHSIQTGSAQSLSFDAAT